MPIFIFVLGILLAINPIVAQFYGAQELEKIGISVRQGLWLSLIIALPAILIVRNLRFVMEMMDYSQEVIPVTLGYLEAISWAFPAIFAYLILRFFNDGISRSKPHLFFSLLAIPLNIAGNYIFMYGHWGVPAMGAVGCGWATAIVWWAMLVGMLIFMLMNKDYQTFSIFNQFGLPKWLYFKEILRIGVPNGVSLGMEISMFAVVSLLIGSLSVAAVAAHQVAINFASLTFTIPLGISIATTSRVGFAVGRKDWQEARLAGNVGIGLSVLVMSVTAWVMFLFPENIVQIYTDEIKVTEIAVQLIMIAAIFQISDGVQVSSAGALRGLKDTQIPMFVNIAAYWGVGISLGYFLGMVQNFGANGLWIGMIAGLTVAAVSHTSRFYFLIRKKIKFLS